MPVDVNTWNVVSQACQIVPQNTVVVSAITPYQLARLLTAPITLADSQPWSTQGPWEILFTLDL